MVWDESLQVLGISTIQDDLTVSLDIGRSSKVHHRRREHPDAGVTMLVVVPGKERWQ